MAAPTLTFGTLNLNDGSTYTLWVGADPGARQKTWDEYRSPSGSLIQVNVTDAYYVESHWPIQVRGSSLATLDAAVEAINTIIDTCTAAAPVSLVYGTTTYQIVASARVSYPRDEGVAVGLWTLLDLVLMRVP